MSQTNAPKVNNKARSGSTQLPAVGIVATSENPDKVAGAILRCRINNHEPILAAQDTDTEAVEFARQLNVGVEKWTDRNETDPWSFVISKAQREGYPGVIRHADLTKELDFEQTRERMSEVDAYVVEPVHNSDMIPSESQSITGGSADTNGRQSTEMSVNSLSPPASDRKGSQADAVEGSVGTSKYQKGGVVAVIPAYNEADSIGEVIQETKPYVDDVIVVNDASSDSTESVARQFADGVVTHPQNMGVGAAVNTGYQVAIRKGYDVVIQIDGDGQHDPSYIPKMLTRLHEDTVDMVIGSRWLNESYQDYSFVRRAGIKFFTYEANLLGRLDISDVTSGFRAYRVSMLDDLQRPESSHWALEQTLEAARKGYEISEISVPMPPATDGSQFDIETFARYPVRMVLITLKVMLFR